MSIEIKNVTRRFGDTLALDNISLELSENKIYGLLGNNGAGKSTLLNIITDRLPASSGSVLLDGANVCGNDAALGKMFLVGEANMFPDDMRVKGAFDAAAMFYPGFDRAYAEHVAAQFGLPLKKKITALSTGYGSIFRLVLGLSVNTQWVFFDEPVLGLDAQHRDLFYRLLLEKYASDPCSVVVSTHLIAEIANLIEETVIIGNGRILQQGATEDLLAAAYTVSGPAAAVEAYASGRERISENLLGGLKTVCLRGTPDDNLPEGLEVGKLNLQDYFINLMEEEIRK